MRKYEAFNELQKYDIAVRLYECDEEDESKLTSLNEDDVKVYMYIDDSLHEHNLLLIQYEYFTGREEGWVVYKRCAQKT